MLIGERVSIKFQKGIRKAGKGRAMGEEVRKAGWNDET